MRFARVLPVVFAFVCVLPAEAQEQKISPAKFAAAERAADARFRAKQIPSRSTIETTSSMEGRPETDYSAHLVLEFAPGGASRSSIVSTLGGKQMPVEQRVTAGGRTFTKTGDEPWEEAKDESSRLAEKADDPDDQTADYRYLGKTLLNGRTARIYLKTARTKRADPATGIVSEQETTTKYWFSDKGDVYRSEYRSTTVTNGKVHHTTIEMQKELDPAITITAPDM
jgi:hypothetical protein